MSGWLRYFALKAQVSTGFSTHIVIGAIVAAVAVMAAVIFLLVTAFVWLTQLYGGVVAGLILAGLFALIALIAAVICIMLRRRNMQRARLELAARSSATWFDPKLVGVGWQIGQAIGWRRLVSLAAVAVLAAAVAKEWSDRDAPADEPSGES